MLLALGIVVFIALFLGANALNRRTISRYIEDGAMPRSKRLQQQVIAAMAKNGETPSWYQGEAPSN